MSQNARQEPALTMQGKKTQIIAIGFLCLFTVSSAHAEFLMNFQVPSNFSGGFPGPCNIAGLASPTVWCATAGVAEETDPDQTPYYQAQGVRIDDANYWRQVIGDPESGFAMEVYTEIWSGFTSYSGGRNSNFPQVLYRQDLDVQSGNGWDPLGLDPALDSTDTGNGTGNPTRVVMRQILGGTWDSPTKTWSCGAAEFCMEFSKAQLDRKPKITQAINETSTGLSARFELDMSNSTYADDTTAGTVINTVIFDDGIGNFDMATDAQNIDITGGRYTYSSGASWLDTGQSSGYETWNYDAGTYSYSSGGFDHLDQDWGSYYDPAQNTSPGPGNEGKCNSGAITGSCL